MSNFLAKNAARIAFVVGVLMIVAPLAGCGNANQMPSPAQIEANLPASLRSCPNLPAAPTGKVTNRKTANYILRLHRVAVICKRRNAELNQLYTAYAGEIARYKAMVKQAAK